MYVGNYGYFNLITSPKVPGPLNPNRPIRQKLSKPCCRQWILCALDFFHVKFSILSSINCPTASSHTKYGPSRVALLHWLSIYLIDILPSY